MVGGDGACMGCGEKTAVHLIISAIHAAMQPRVARHLARLDELIGALDHQARELLAADADLDAAARTEGTVPVPVDAAKHERLALLTRTLQELRQLKWRYLEGPSGRGRAALGMANSTGCSSVWGSTYPYNPYPFPWVNHLFQDSPSIAIGLFEAHMRKMADGFVTLRRADLLQQGSYQSATHEPLLAALEWQHFSDEEFALCPPIVAMGGDGAMLDIGFQNLSRLMASGKPIRVIVLDTQVYSNTGGQACTSGFTGQVADMSAYGKAQHGKTEARKELALIAIAHRGVFVHQSSQASASHLMAGVLKALKKRRPVLLNIYTPCPVEHGLPDDWAQHAARLALESRAFPYLTYDPDAGPALADCLTLEGNPSPETAWPTYTLEFDADGGPRSLELPLDLADDALLPFHEYLAAETGAREGRTPFIYAVSGDRKLRRLRVAEEIVRLAEERQEFWSLLRQLAGHEVAPAVRDTIVAELEAEYERRAGVLRQEFEARYRELELEAPRRIARRLAEGLLRTSGGSAAVAELLASLPATSPSNGPAKPVAGVAPALAAPLPAPEPKPTAPEVAASGPAIAAALEEEPLGIDAYIDSVRCTSCNECTNLNGRMFAYNAEKQAYIKDASAGTFQQLVLAAERCPVSIIHPGTPLNPKEKDLPKWAKRAERFQ